MAESRVTLRFFATCEGEMSSQAMVMDIVVGADRGVEQFKYLSFIVVQFQFVGGHPAIQFWMV